MMRETHKIQGLVFFAAFCTTMALSSIAVAEDVRVRTGAHEQYSRLVFDWTSRVDYTVERAAESLSVSFSRAATLDTSKADANPVRNIKSIERASEDPLKVTLSIPAESRVRDLRAGNKVVIDIYNPPGAPPPKPKEQPKEPPKAQPPKLVAEKNTPPKAEPKPEAQSPEEPPEETTPESAPDQAALKEIEKELQGEGQIIADQAPQTRQLTMREKPTLITISSTQNFGMAAFELNDRLWMINDKSDLLLKPQLSGPRAESFSEMDEIALPQAKAYVVQEPISTSMRGEGGGILWRIKIGNNLPMEKTFEPVRTDVTRQDPRSGTLLWPLDGARRIIDIEDPLTGRQIKAITVEDAKSFAGPPREFIDFEVLHAPIGLVIAPKVEDLQVQIVRGGVEISRPDGLTMVDGELLASMTKRKLEPSTQKSGAEQNMGPRIFDFKAWQLGGVGSMLDNKRIILAGLNDQPETAQAENLLTLGKMYLSNAMGPEALGVLNLALMRRPGLSDSPEFNALLGAANALSRHNEDGFVKFSLDALKPFGEIRYWRAYILADVGDWQQAADILPTNLAPLYDYPVLLQNRLVPVLAEIALRAGDLPRAQELLRMVEKNKARMKPQQKAAMAYLRGEAARQQKDIEVTKKHWAPLTTGPNDLYRAKAGLALTRLLVNEGELATDKAVDNLERLRYAWRGDQLEVQINYWLGRTYFEDGQYLKGLKIMRDAVSYDTGTPLGQRVAAEMADLFAELFLGQELDLVSPLDAISLYDEFKELVPLDERGNRIIERLAEHLAASDLLTRAGDLLKYQLDHRLQGVDIYRIGVRLAAIRLLDNMPDKAMAVLNTAAAQLEQLPEEMRTPKRYRDISLLRARATSLKGRPDQALALLNDLDRTPDMNRLRADIAWTAGYWDDAAEALGDVILDENISMTRPLDDMHTGLLLQRAVSLNLAGDRIGLANMREKFSDLMAQTSKAKVFEVITRPRQSGALADRETLLSTVSEVDLFKDFLDSYKNAAPPSN